MFSGCQVEAVQLDGQDVDLGVHNFVTVASGRSLTFLGRGLIVCTLGLAGTVPQGYRDCSEGLIPHSHSVLSAHI